MKINEIKLGMSDITVEGKVADKSEEMKVQTRYGQRSVCDITLENETGAIKLSLWEEAIDMVDIGDKIRVSGVYVTQFRNQIQLNMPDPANLKLRKRTLLKYKKYSP